jgi:RNA polymerase sigma-70 factor, ECF subfamily
MGDVPRAGVGTVRAARHDLAVSSGATAEADCLHSPFPSLPFHKLANGGGCVTHTSLSLLEQLCTKPDEAAWRRLCDLYRPLIRRWLTRDPTLRDEADDLVQDVLAVLIRELPHFRWERPGSFRSWLRTITWNRLQAYWQSRRHRPQPLGGGLDDGPLAQLEHPDSDLSRRWDEEHDRHVVGRLMGLIESQFEPDTLRAFRRTVFDGAKATEVAAELGISVNAVLLAKSRVLKRLRQEGEGLIG